MEKLSKPYQVPKVNLNNAIEALVEKARMDVARENYRTWLAEQFTLLENEGHVVESLYLCAETYRQIRLFFKDEFEPVTRRALIKTGYMGDLWGAAVRLDKTVELGRVKLVSEEEEESDQAT